MQLRYYTDPPIREWRDWAIELLETIEEQHGITVEIEHVEQQYEHISEFTGTVRQSTAQEVYERDLKNNRAVIESTGERPSEAFKRNGTLELGGNVVVVGDGGTVQWASTRPGYADGYGPAARSQTAMNFLEDIAQSPSNRLCIGCARLLSGGERFCPSCGLNFHSTTSRHGSRKYRRECSHGGIHSPPQSSVSQSGAVTIIRFRQGCVTHDSQSPPIIGTRITAGCSRKLLHPGGGLTIGPG
jgi:hypothetical protein